MSPDSILRADVSVVRKVPNTALIALRSADSSLMLRGARRLPIIFRPVPDDCCIIDCWCNYRSDEPTSYLVWCTHVLFAIPDITSIKLVPPRSPLRLCAIAQHSRFWMYTLLMSSRGADYSWDSRDSEGTFLRYTTLIFKDLTFTCIRWINLLHLGRSWNACNQFEFDFTSPTIESDFTSRTTYGRKR